MELLSPIFLFIALISIAGVSRAYYLWKDRTFFKHIYLRTRSNELSHYSCIFQLHFLSSWFLLLFAPFRCYPQSDGSYTLIPKPSEDCFGSSWKSRLLVIAFGILEISMIPLGIFVILRRYKGNMENNSVFQWRYGLLTRSYKPQYYW